MAGNDDSDRVFYNRLEDLRKMSSFGLLPMSEKTPSTADRPYNRMPSSLTGRTSLLGSKGVTSSVRLSPNDDALLALMRSRPANVTRVGPTAAVAPARSGSGGAGGILQGHVDNGSISYSDNTHRGSPYHRSQPPPLLRTESESYSLFGNQRVNQSYPRSVSNTSLPPINVDSAPISFDTVQPGSQFNHRSASDQSPLLIDVECGATMLDNVVQQPGNEQFPLLINDDYGPTTFDIQSDTSSQYDLCPFPPIDPSLQFFQNPNGALNNFNPNPIPVEQLFPSAFDYGPTSMDIHGGPISDDLLLPSGTGYSVFNLLQNDQQYPNGVFNLDPTPATLTSGDQLQNNFSYGLPSPFDIAPFDDGPTNTGGSFLPSILEHPVLPLGVDPTTTTTITSNNSCEQQLLNNFQYGPTSPFQDGSTGGSIFPPLLEHPPVEQESFDPTSFISDDVMGFGSPFNNSSIINDLLPPIESPQSLDALMNFIPNDDFDTSCKGKQVLMDYETSTFSDIQNVSQPFQNSAFFTDSSSPTIPETPTGLLNNMITSKGKQVMSSSSDQVMDCRQTSMDIQNGSPPLYNSSFNTDSSSPTLSHNPNGVMLNVNPNQRTSSGSPPFNHHLGSFNTDSSSPTLSHNPNGVMLNVNPNQRTSSGSPPFNHHLGSSGDSSSQSTFNFNGAPRSSSTSASSGNSHKSTTPFLTIDKIRNIMDDVEIMPPPRQRNNLRSGDVGGTSSKTGKGVDSVDNWKRSLPHDLDEKSPKRYCKATANRLSAEKSRLKKGEISKGLPHVTDSERRLAHLIKENNEMKQRIETLKAAESERQREECNKLLKSHNLQKQQRQAQKEKEEREREDRERRQRAEIEKQVRERRERQQQQQQQIKALLEDKQKREQEEKTKKLKQPTLDSNGFINFNW